MEDSPENIFGRYSQATAKFSALMQRVGETLNQLNQRLEKSLEIDAQIRGKILIYSIAVETSLDEFLASYFCRDPETKKLFQSTILKGLNLPRKIDTVDTILKRNHPDLHKEHSSLKGNLKEILERRNKLAHSEPSRSIIDQMMNLENEQLTLETFENGEEKPFIITKKDADEFVRQMKATMEELSTLSELLASPKVGQSKLLSS